MECHGCVGRGHDPLVVCFMQVLIDERVVEAAVDEVDAEIGEDEEQWELKPIVPGTWAVCEGIVEFGVTADFSEEEGCGEERNPGHGVYGLANFHSDLVFEEFGCLKVVLSKTKM